MLIKTKLELAETMAARDNKAMAAVITAVNYDRLVRSKILLDELARSCFA